MNQEKLKQLEDALNQWTALDPRPLDKQKQVVFKVDTFPHEGKEYQRVMVTVRDKDGQSVCQSTLSAAYGEVKETTMAEDFAAVVRMLAMSHILSMHQLAGIKKQTS